MKSPNGSISVIVGWVDLSDFYQGGKEIGISPLLLAFLDLYHFPLRGREQAEFMAERILDLRHISKKV